MLVFSSGLAVTQWAASPPRSHILQSYGGLWPGFWTLHTHCCSSKQLAAYPTPCVHQSSSVTNNTHTQIICHPTCMKMIKMDSDKSSTLLLMNFIKTCMVINSLCCLWKKEARQVSPIKWYLIIVCFTYNLKIIYFTENRLRGKWHFPNVRLDYGSHGTRWQQR